MRLFCFSISTIVFLNAAFRPTTRQEATVSRSLGSWNSREEGRYRLRDRGADMLKKGNTDGVGLDTDIIKPLLIHSSTREFDSPQIFTDAEKLPDMGIAR
eukprot:4678059-Pyramimonas_sp.AAC.1